MGWLNTIIDVASLGMEIAQVDRLSDLRKQNATAAVMQAILQELRTQIFNYKQAAQSILELEERSPRLAAGGLRVLEERLKAAGITADLFPEISDKEYVAETYKFMRDNANRLISQLPPEDAQEINAVVNSASRLPKYNYYIDNEISYRQFKTAKANLENPGPFGGSPNKFGCSMALASIVIVVLFASIFRESPSTGFFLGTVVSIGMIVYFGRNIRTVRKAKETAEYLDKKLEVGLLARIDSEVNGDVRSAIRLRDEAAERLKDFFGEIPSLPM